MAHVRLRPSSSKESLVGKEPHCRKFERDPNFCISPRIKAFSAGRLLPSASKSPK